MKRSQVATATEKITPHIGIYISNESLQSPSQKLQQTIQLNSKLFRCQSDETKLKILDKQDQSQNLFHKYTTEAYK